MTAKISDVENIEHPIDPQIRAEILATLVIEFHLERLASVAAPAMPEGLHFTILDRLLHDTVLEQTALIKQPESASTQCR